MVHDLIIGFFVPGDLVLGEFNIGQDVVNFVLIVSSFG